MTTLKRHRFGLADRLAQAEQETEAQRLARTVGTFGQPHHPPAHRAVTGGLEGRDLVAEYLAAVDPAAPCLVCGAPEDAHDPGCMVDDTTCPHCGFEGNRVRPGTEDGGWFHVCDECGWYGFCAICSTPLEAGSLYPTTCDGPCRRDWHLMQEADSDA